MKKSLRASRIFLAGRAVAALLSGISACAGDSPGDVTDPLVQPPVPGAIEYAVKLPDGKLPWPQHVPEFTAAQYAAMQQDLFIINNFGLYQAGSSSDRNSMYLHDGLDIVLPNGTKIHAIEAGYVRSIVAAVLNYKYIVVEDADTPGSGWAYVHTDDFTVKVGDFVPQGKWIANVRFQGIEHIHLDRVHGSNFSNYMSLTRTQPDGFFVYTDVDPPEFAGAFHYLENGTETRFPPGAPAVVHGDVDIVVGLRERGQYARRPNFPTGDRLAVTRIEYDIAPVGGVPVTRKSFDLTTAHLPRLGPGQEYKMAQTLFAFYGLFYPSGNPAWWQTGFSFYTITNSPPGGRTGVLTPDDAAESWRTADVPNGEYSVTVRAWDFKGNRAERSETVLVAN